MKVFSLKGFYFAFPGTSNVGENLPTGQLSTIPWRRTGVKYTNNEAYFDVIEEIDAIVDKSGNMGSFINLYREHSLSSMFNVLLWDLLWAPKTFQMYVVLKKICLPVICPQVRRCVLRYRV